MTGMWLVCLSLLVAADAASIASKPVGIPVQVVYDDVVQFRQLSSLKNLEAKPQLSTEEKVEAEVLHIPEIIAKIAQPVQDEVKNEDSSSQSVESSEEKVADAVSVENSSSEESNEIESNNIENLKLKLENPEPVEEIEVAEVAAVPIDEAVVLEADTAQVQEVVPEVQEVVPVQDEKTVDPEDKVKFVPVKAQDSIALRQASSTTTTPQPNRPILGFINRLGETIGNTLNGLRPQTTGSSTASPPVAPAETPQVSEEGLPIAAATAEEDPSAPTASETAPPSTAAPTFINQFQNNVNNQLNSFGNRVNGFINNLRPKAPEGSQNEEEPTTPNTPLLNGIQEQFNTGFQSFSNSVNNAFNFLAPNNPNATQTQSDETSEQPPQNTNPIIQTISNAATNFQQTFAGFISGQSQNQPQSDESSPANATNPNIGQAVFQVFQNGISNIVQTLRPNNTATQGDEAAPAQPSNPITGLFGNLGQQFNNFITGGQSNNATPAIPGIPSQLPGAEQFQNFTPPGLGQIPGADQLQNFTSQFQNFTPSALPGVGQIPGADQFQNITSQFPGAGQFPGVGQIPGVDQFQNIASQFPGAEQFPGVGQIPGADQFQNITSQLPGAGQIPGVGQIPGADQFQNLTSQLPQLPAGIPNFPPIAGAPSPAAPDSSPTTTTASSAAAE